MLPGYIILGLGAALIIAVIVWAWSSYGDREQDFVRHLQNQGRNLFTQVQAFDPSAYPETPLEVMELFMAARHLLYGDMVLNEDITRYAFYTMRQLMSDEIYGLYTPEQHYEQLQSEIADLKELGIRIFTVNIGTVNFSPIDPTFCEVQVTENLVGPTESPAVRWNYYLNFEDGRWKVAGWNTVS
jgi:hypothetical protein